MVASQPSTSSAGEANNRAPASVSALVFAESRFQTAASWPTAINRWVIADPIRPVPQTPTFMIHSPFLAGIPASMCVKDAEVLRNDHIVVRKLRRRAVEHA